jgi:hypothetical protein
VFLTAPDVLADNPVDSVHAAADEVFRGRWRVKRRCTAGFVDPERGRATEPQARRWFGTAPVFVFAFAAFLVISFVALATYLAIRSRWIRVSFGSPLLHAELGAEKPPPWNEQGHQMNPPKQGKGRAA